MHICYLICIYGIPMEFLAPDLMKFIDDIVPNIISLAKSNKLVEGFAHSVSIYVAPIEIFNNHLNLKLSFFRISGNFWQHWHHNFSWAKWSPTPSMLPIWMSCWCNLINNNSKQKHLSNYDNIWTCIHSWSSKEILRKFIVFYWPS